MKTRFILLTLLIVLVFPLISAEVQSLGNFQRGECVRLIQTCPNCTYVNITSVIYPNSTQAIGMVSMTKIGTLFNYEFCNTSAVGQYIVNGVGDIDGEDTTWVYDFLITPRGQSFSLGDILIYTFFLLLCLAVAYASYKLIKGHPPSEDQLVTLKLYETRKRNEFLYFLKVLESKLWTVGLFGLYLSLLVFLVVLNQVVSNLNLVELNEILQYAVIIFSWGLVPFVIFWIGYIFITFYKASSEIFMYEMGVLRR